MKLFTILLVFSSLALFTSRSDEENEENIIPIFSLKGGFYNADSIKLDISIEDPEAVIYYTLDGSDPTINSTIYKDLLILKDKSLEENVYSKITNVTGERSYVPNEKVKKGNIVRAMAKLSDGTFTPIISRTYFVGLNRKELYGDVPVISIITDPENLFGYEKGIYTMGKMYDDWVKENPENAQKHGFDKIGNYNMKGKESERPASIEYFPSDDKKDGFAENVGIRIAGAVSRTFIQKSLRVLFRKEYGKKNLKYELLPENERSDGQGIVNKYKSFILRNGGNDYEYAKIRDKALQDLISNRNLETQQGEVIVLFLDGEYWGVYILTEDYNDHYFENNYDIADDNVIIIKNSRIEAGEESDKSLFNQASSYIQNQDMSNPSNYKQAGEYLDIEDFMWCAAFNIYIGNRDSIFKASNWGMWRVRNPVENVKNADGKWRMLIYDNDLSAGLFGNENDYNNLLFSEIFNENSHYSKCIGSRFLTSFLKNSTFKNMFINSLCDIRNIDFEINRVYDYMDKLISIIQPLMRDNFIRFGKAINAPEEYYKGEVSKLKTWLYSRYDSFINNIGNFFEFKSPVEVSITSNNFLKGSFTVNNGWKIFEEEFKGLYFTENILYISANPLKGKGTFDYWRVKNCKSARSSDENDFKSEDTNLSIYPLEGCSVIAYYK